MNDGKEVWIESRAAVLVKLRGMNEGDALAKARAEWAHYFKLDARCGDRSFSQGGNDEG